VGWIEAGTTQCPNTEGLAAGRAATGARPQTIAAIDSGSAQEYADGAPHWSRLDGTAPARPAGRPTSTRTCSRLQNADCRHAASTPDVTRSDPARAIRRRSATRGTQCPDVWPAPLRRRVRRA